jgi:hypothetical protein
MTNRLATASVAAAIALTSAIPVWGQSSTPRREPAVDDIAGFNIVLVVGESQKGGSAAARDGRALPEGAAKALKDMSEFLPYKQYRVLDAQWRSCCGPEVRTTVTGRLEGVIGSPRPDGSVQPATRIYGFKVAADRSTERIPVRFELTVQEPDMRRAAQFAERTQRVELERRDLQAEIESLAAQIQRLQKRVEVGTAPADDLRSLQDRQASVQRRLVDVTERAAEAARVMSAVTQTEGLLPPREIIDSSFTMVPGETVVVGTSKLGGDQALIALVTAVRKGGRE